MYFVKLHVLLVLVTSTPPAPLQMSYYAVNTGVNPGKQNTRVNRDRVSSKYLMLRTFNQHNQQTGCPF